MILTFKKIAHITLALGLVFATQLMAQPGHDHDGYPGHPGYPPPNHGVYETVVMDCSSSGYAYKSCPVYGRIIEARLLRRVSHSDCVLGQSWGYFGNELWVDKGCRAEFQVSYESHHGGGGGYPPNPPHYGNSEIVSCSSSGYAYNTCYPYNRGYITRVHLQTQHSRSECREGSSWGYTSEYIWVNNGCRADFRVEFGR